MNAVLAPTWPESLEKRFGPVAAVDLALYAAASGDHNPLHLDEEVAHAAGFERPVVHGMLSMAYAGRLFSARFGPGCVLCLSTRFTGVALRGDELLFRATLRAVLPSGAADYDLSACTGRGTEVLSGSAQVARQAGAC